MLGCIRPVSHSCSYSVGPRPRAQCHRTDMLKHKLRKSRKNILSLLEFHEEDEKRDTIPEYSEIKKTGRKDKMKKGRYT